MGGDAPTWPPKQAPSRTLLGMLQRGTGRGYREALRRPEEGRTALWECITRDPRWDHQIEERGDYYGRLAVELEIPPTEVLAWLQEHDDVDETSGGKGWLMRDIAEWQLKAAVPGAGTTFLWIIEFGYRWEDALCSVDDIESAVPWRRVAAALRRRFPGREALRAAFDGTPPHVAARLAQFDPWFDVQPAEERAEDRPAPVRYSSQELQAASLEQLLDYGDDFKSAKLAAGEIRRRNIPIADLAPVLFRPRPRGPFVEVDGRRVRTRSGKTNPPSVIAMRSMVGRNDPAVFDAAVKVITRYRGMRHGRFQLKRFAREALVALPAGQVLPLARAWRDSRTSDMALTGIEILRRHATAEDVP
ncbi:MAG: hypothetical protein IT303_08595 [Dehalococcoidia bacterium]|nr:hypothetical protein [Dehalococcoidia bacterium]